MKLGLPWALGCFGVLFVGSALIGCLGDLKVTQPDPGGAGGVAGAGGGEGGGAGTGGGAAGAGGGAMPCVPLSVVPCNTGLSGICADGMATCNADGMTLGPCQAVNTASFDDCKTPDDENCDGSAVSECTGAIDWTVGRVGASMAPQDDAVFGVAVIPTGGYAVTGVVDGAIDTALAVTAGKMYIAKLDGAGVQQWERSLAATTLSVGRAVAADGMGNIVVVGEFTGTLTIDGFTVMSAGPSKDVFIGKFNAMGEALWIKGFGSTALDTASAVAIDASNNIVFTGRVRGGVVDFGGGGVDADGDDLFVVKFAPNGTHIWSKIFVNLSDQRGRAIALTSSGDVVVAGESNGNFTFGGPTHTVAEGTDGFIAQFSGADGAFVWSRVLLGPSDQVVTDLAMLPNGNPVAGGYFSDSMDLGGGNVLTSAGPISGFVAEFNISSGAHVRSLGYGTGSVYGMDMAADGAGHVYIEGMFVGTVGIDPKTTTAVDGFDEFTMKLDAASWAPLWVRSSGEVSNQRGFAISVGPQGRAIVGGLFEVELTGTMMSETLLTTGGDDLFVRRLEP